MLRRAMERQWSQMWKVFREPDSEYPHSRQARVHWGQSVLAFAAEKKNLENIIQPISFYSRLLPHAQWKSPLSKNNIRKMWKYNGNMYQYTTLKINTWVKSLRCPVHWANIQTISLTTSWSDGVWWGVIGLVLNSSS